MLKKGRSKRMRDRKRGRERGEREGEGGRGRGGEREERERGREGGGRERGEGREGGRGRGRELNKRGERREIDQYIQRSHLLPGAMVVFIIDGPTSESLSAATVTSMVTPSTKYVALVILCSNIVSLTRLSTIALVTKRSSLLNITVLAETV